jgi:hypothetical protein
MSDFISRNAFNERIGMDSEALAKEAFQAMDVHLDLTLQRLYTIDSWKATDLLKEYQDVFEELPENTTKLVKGIQWSRDSGK